MSFPNHVFLFTADIESLYTNIDTDRGLWMQLGKFSLRSRISKDQMKRSFNYLK